MRDIRSALPSTPQWEQSERRIALKIAIIGKGNVANALGQRWNDGAHEVMFGVRRPDQHEPPVPSERKTIRIAALDVALDWGELIVLALPYEAALELLRTAGPLSEKVIVDATNPLAPGLTGLSAPPGSSGAEELQKLQPHAHVIKCFNTTGYNNMIQPQYGAHDATMLLCGSDAVAKVSVKLLAEELGFAPVDAGPLNMAHHLESLAYLWIKLALSQGHGREIAFVLHSR